MRRDLCDLSNEVMVKHFCIDVLSILILKIYKYWSSLLVCLYDESVSNFSSSYLSFSVPMNKDNFQKQFFFTIFNFLHGSFICSHNTNNENYQKNYQKEAITMYDILLKTPLAHVYNYFWWTVTLLELVWKQEINLPIYSPYKVNLFPSKLLWVKKRWTSHGNSTYLR